MIRLSSRCCSRSLTATHLANVVAMALNLEVTNCPLRFARIRGINPSTGVFLATMKDLSARLEPTRPQQATSSRISELLRWTILRPTSTITICKSWKYHNEEGVSTRLRPPRVSRPIPMRRVDEAKPSSQIKGHGLASTHHKERPITTSQTP